MVSKKSNDDLTGMGTFNTTHWSVVLAAGRAEDADSTIALEKLCRTYWSALYSFVRRQGYCTPDAQDLTQEFFRRFLARNYVERADPARGRFRSFLLSCLKNFLANEWKSSRTQKRGGGQEMISWDADAAENCFLQEPSTLVLPEDAFEKRWAALLLQEVLARLRSEFSAAGKSSTFEALKLFLWGADSSISYAELSAQLSSSEGAARVAVHRFRQRYRELLRTTIGETVRDPREVDEELRHLISVIAL